MIQVLSLWEITVSLFTGLICFNASLTSVKKTISCNNVENKLTEMRILCYSRYGIPIWKNNIRSIVNSKYEKFERNSK